MDNEISGKSKDYDLHELIDDLQEKLEDIQNITQLLEMSLANNGDDPHIIKSVGIIDKMLAAIIKEDLEALRNSVQHE
ncbi:MAG: hypothetical protein J6K48_03230 [Lachnospiraceae bacterium]|nr:hypothetical protein [Lachnospiraceae bacterium]